MSTATGKRRAEVREDGAQHDPKPTTCEGRGTRTVRSTTRNHSPPLFLSATKTSAPVAPE